jgi:acyl-CoA synthetase (AMP-forming)/AMP-acid ligase II
MPTLGDIIERNAAHFPHQLALAYGERRSTHAQFAQRVRRLASALGGLGLARQDRFSVLAMNCSEFMEAYGAAELAGYVINTVNFRLAAPEIAYVLKDAAPKVLLFEQQYADLVAALRPQCDSIGHYVCIADPAMGPVPAWASSYEDVLRSGAPDGPAPALRARADDCLCLIYTSGTTGRPKGVMQSQRAAAALSEILSGELSLMSNARLLAIAPLFHMGARSLASGAHWRGGAVVLQRGFDAEEVIRTIERERISAVHLVPTMVQALLDAPNFGRHDLSSLTMLMYAAAPMPVPLLKRAMEAFGPILFNGYGQTEINLLTLLHPHQHFLSGTAQQLGRLASVGQPHPRSAIRIVADDGAACAPGVPGEVLARSPTAMSGYWNNPGATIDTLQDGWIRTGDMGYLDQEGYLFLVDRKKDMIISGGENIYCREVEDAVAMHPAVAEVAVIGVADAHWGEAVKAVVVCRPGASLAAEQLIAHCKGLIASYKCPKSVAIVDALPRLVTGKVNKVALRALHKGLSRADI